ncbi:MAG: hypothetical protein LBL13_01435, partial [Bacteroidales bacterium]|nr:hypothetical protein [Bacteroidales bacterium]
YQDNHSNHINHSSYKRGEGTKGLSSCPCRDAKLRVSRNNGKGTNPVRHCRLDPQRREASRLYISGDSDFRQNDGYCYTGELSRMGLNMYNPLQAERSWGYKMTPTLSELRSSSICYQDNHLNHINHSSDERGRMDEGTKGRKVQATSISSWLACLPVACCLLLAACCLLPVACCLFLIAL